MFDGLKFIWFKINKREKGILFLTIMSPLIFSFLLYLLSFVNIEIIDPRLKYYLIVMWLFPFSFFLIISSIFLFYCTRNEDFKKNKSRIIGSVVNLPKNRLKDLEKLTVIVAIAILTFYFLELTPILLVYYQYNVFTSSLIFSSFLFLFLLSINLLVNIFTGLREKGFNRYFIFVPLFFVWLIYYVLILSKILPLNLDDDFNLLNMFIENTFWIIPTIISIIIAFFLGRGKLKKNLPEKAKVGWEKSIYPFALVVEVFLCLDLLLNLVLLETSLDILSIENFSMVLTFLAILIAIAIIADLYVGFFILSYPSTLFINNMIDWSKFFECYNGPTITELGEYPKSLIKISGKCRAISIKEKYRKKYESFNQHFLLEVDDSREDIDVISLEETNPFINTKPLVRESDNITIVGEMKSILNDEILFPNDNRISDLILAHHIEPKSNESAIKEINETSGKISRKNMNEKKYETVTKEIDNLFGGRI